MSQDHICKRCGQSLSTAPPDTERAEIVFGAIVDPEQMDRAEARVTRLCESCTSDLRQWLK